MKETNKNWNEGHFWKSPDWERNLLTVKKREELEKEGQLRLIPDIGSSESKPKRKPGIKKRAKEW